MVRAQPRRTDAVKASAVFVLLGFAVLNLRTRLQLSDASSFGGSVSQGRGLAFTGWQRHSRPSCERRQSLSGAPTTATAAVADSAVSTEDVVPDALRVSRDTSPGKLAGAVKARMMKDGKVEMVGVSPASLHALVKSMVIATQYLEQEDDEWGALAASVRKDEIEYARSGDSNNSYTFTVQEVEGYSADAAAGENVVEVDRDTDVEKLSKTIAGSEQTTLAVMSPTEVYKAIEAIEMADLEMDKPDGTDTLTLTPRQLETERGFVRKMLLDCRPRSWYEI